MDRSINQSTFISGNAAHDWLPSPEQHNETMVNV